jgi:hypothetical protein
MKWQEGGDICIIRSPIIYVIRKIKSRRMRWVGHVAHMGEMKNEYEILGRNTEVTEWKRPFERARRRWEDNI